MRNWKRAALALMITVAMVCSMLMPAFGWLVTSCFLRSPDGLFWFDVRYIMQGDWTTYSGGDVTVCSPNGIVWYTQEGISFYHIHMDELGDDWQSITLPGTASVSDYSTPDGGKIWLYASPSNYAFMQWTDWLDVWPESTYYDGTAPQVLYHYGPDSYVLHTGWSYESAGTISLEELGVYSDAVNGSVAVNFSARCEGMSNSILLSADGETWKTTLTEEDMAYAFPNHHSNGRVRPSVSYVPHYPLTGTVSTVTLNDDQTMTITYDDDCGDHTMVYYGFQIKALYPCTFTLHLRGTSPAVPYVYAAAQAVPSYYTGGAGIEPDENYDPSSAFNSMDNQVLVVNAAGSSYVPVLVQPDETVTALDVQGNGILDTEDTIISGQNPLAPYTITSQTDGSLTLRFSESDVANGRTLTIPIWFWAEGQDAHAIGAITQQSVSFEAVIRRDPTDNEMTASPFYYIDNGDNVTITYCNSDLLSSAPGADPQLFSDYTYDPTTGCLTVPSLINGKPVTIIGDCAFADVTTSTFDGIGTTNPVRQIILPNSVQYICNYAFGPALERLHVPYMAIPEMYAYSLCVDRSDMTICSDLPRSQTELMLTSCYPPASNFTFVVCTDHGTSHTHTFDEWVENIPAACTYEGERSRTCTVCGFTESQAIPATGHIGCGDWIDDEWVVAWICDAYTHSCNCVFCGEKLIESHTFDAIETPATCAAEGCITYTCPDCHYSYKETIPAAGHTFGDWVVTREATADTEGEETRTCTVCGVTETRTIDKLFVPAKLSVIGGRARPGKTVQVSVDLSDNPGIIATMLRLEYDPQILTLTAVDNGDVFVADAFQPGGDITAVPFTVFWQDALANADNTANGTLVTFTFIVEDDSPLGETPVRITYEQESTFNQQLQTVTFTTENGYVTVYDRMPGDADDDGVLDLKDVVNLSRYIAGGWNVEADERNADVDGDSKLTLKDVVLLQRYLAGGWGVELL